MQNATFNYDLGHTFWNENGELITVISVNDRAKPGTRILIIESAIEHRVFPCPDWLARHWVDVGQWTTR
ncbi:MAG: hypothetical protein JXA89_10225 [Anaerolineae bacterium]|nr:hypothetical protein [Anaerolineae bacterium]